MQTTQLNKSLESVVSALEALNQGAIELRGAAESGNEIGPCFRVIRHFASRLGMAMDEVEVEFLRAQVPRKKRSCPTPCN